MTTSKTLDEEIAHNASIMNADEYDLYLIGLASNVMNAILVKKMAEGKIVFSGVESGLLN